MSSLHFLMYNKLIQNITNNKDCIWLFSIFVYCFCVVHLTRPILCSHWMHLISYSRCEFWFQVAVTCVCLVHQKRFFQRVRAAQTLSSVNDTWRSTSQTELNAGKSSTLKTSLCGGETILVTYRWLVVHSPDQGFFFCIRFSAWNINTTNCKINCIKWSFHCITDTIPLNTSLP